MFNSTDCNSRRAKRIRSVPEREERSDELRNEVDLAKDWNDDEAGNRVGGYL